MKKTKQYKVLISENYRDMLAQHVAFLAMKNISAARKIKQAISKSIMTLKIYPERYPMFTQHALPQEYRKMFIPNWFMIIYEVREDTVWVEYILDCRKNNKWLLAQKDD